MTDAALLAAIAEAPDDPAPYLVYADALLERGDPRGELITVQHALETTAPADAAELRRREGEALLAHAELWTPLATQHRRLLVVGWKCGFVHAARVIYDSAESDPTRRPQRAAIAAFRALLAVPHIGSTLAELHLGPPFHADASWPPCQVFLDALFARWPPALRRLHLNDGDLRGMHAAPTVPLRELARHAGTLDTLVACGRNVDRLPELPKLRKLELRVPAFDLARLADVATWPALEELVIWPHRLGTLATLTPARFPRLRHLGLVGTSDLAAHLPSLVKLPLIAQLGSLDVSGGTLTDVGPLARLAGALRIDVRKNLIERAAIGELEERGFLARPQRTGANPLTDATELATLAGRLSRRVGDRTLAPPARLKKVVAAAERGDPRWAYGPRGPIAIELDKAAKRDALIELVRDIERDLSPSGHASLYRALATACEELGELAQTESWLWLAVRAARWSGRSEELHQAQGHIATVRMRRGDSATAAQLLERHVARARKQKAPTQEAWAERQLANTRRMRNDFAAAEVHYRRALALYKQLGRTEDQSIVLSELSAVYWARSDFAGAEAMLREAIAMRDADSVGLGSTYYNLGAILNGANRIADAIAAAQTSRDIFRKQRHRSGEAQALSLLGELYQRKNDHATAQRLLEEALAAHRATGGRPHVGITLGNLSRVALDRAEYDRARAYCEEAIEIHREVGNKYNEGMQLLGLGDAAIGEQRFADALAAFDEAFVPLRAIGNAPGIACVHLHRGIAQHLAGDDAAAAAAYDACIAAARGQYEELVGWAEMWIAIRHARAGDRAAAETTLAGARRYLPAESIQGAEALAMAAVVIARLAGDEIDLPEAQSWDARILARFCPALPAFSGP